MSSRQRMSVGGIGNEVESVSHGRFRGPKWKGTDIAVDPRIKTATGAVRQRGRFGNGGRLAGGTSDRGRDLEPR